MKLRLFPVLPSGLLIAGSILFSQLACKKKINDQTLVYQNDFESGSLSGIVRGGISTFNNSKVLGFFNKHGFTLQLVKLPAHNYIEVTFDLQLHDSWDGNRGGVDGPDFWEIKIDDRPYFKTTFAFRPCGGDDCNSQSYPAAYPANNYPRTGSQPDQIHGGCILFPEPNGTVLYHFVRLIPHTGDSFKMDADDELKQLDVPDYLQACDESWSVDNIVIKAVDVK